MQYHFQLCLLKICRCAEELKQLYLSSEVQSFLNGTPSIETLSKKEIYQPGCLRKVIFLKIIITFIITSNE